MSSKRKCMRIWAWYPCEWAETAELRAKRAAGERNREEARKQGHEVPLGEGGLSEKRAS